MSKKETRKLPSILQHATWYLKLIGFAKVKQYLYTPMLLLNGMRLNFQ